MSDDKADLRRRAEAIGLGRLSDDQLEDLARGAAAVAAVSKALARDFGPADEPAHIFQARVRER